MNITAEQINELKKSKNAVILAHNYQIPEIQAIADFTGDSLELAKKAMEIDENLIVFCGVLFMAETASILNPNKKVLIPSLDALCPMANMLKTKDIINAKKEHPDALVVLYINTRVEAKVYADAVCTSANFLDIINSAPSDEIIFGPDINLAQYAIEHTDKKIIPVPTDGYCYVHTNFSRDNILKNKKDYPNAEILVHPECLPEVQEEATHICSTGQMLKRAKISDKDEFVIVTERDMVTKLKNEFPNKNFYPAIENAICKQQKKITLDVVYKSLCEEIYEVEVPKEIADKAKKSIERMINGW